MCQGIDLSLTLRWGHLLLSFVGFLSPKQYKLMDFFNLEQLLAACVVRPLQFFLSSRSWKNFVITFHNWHNPPNQGSEFTKLWGPLFNECIGPRAATLGSGGGGCVGISKYIDNSFTHNFRWTRSFRAAEKINWLVTFKAFAKWTKKKNVHLTMFKSLKQAKLNKHYCVASVRPQKLQDIFNIWHARLPGQRFQITWKVMN